MNIEKYSFNLLCVLVIVMISHSSYAKQVSDEPEPVSKFPGQAKITTKSFSYSNSIVRKVDSVLNSEFGRVPTELNGKKPLDAWQRFLKNGGQSKSDKLNFEDCYFCFDDEIQLEFESEIEKFMEPDGSFYDHKVSFTLKLKIVYTGRGIFAKSKTINLTEKEIIAYFDWKFKPHELDVLADRFPKVFAEWVNDVEF